MSEIVAEYEAMRIAIRENLSIIRNLVKQAEAYHTLIDGLKNDDAKKKFEKNLKDINKTIDSLIKQTDFIFNQYIELASKNVGLVAN